MLKPISFTIYIGDDVDQLLQVVENDLPVDITAATELELFLRKPDGSAPLYLTASKTNTKLVNATPSQGLFRLVLPAADTATLKEICEPSDFDVVVTNAASKKKTYRFEAAVLVLARRGPSGP